ncbi:cell surface hyaluronidase CEMIP2 isoform X2 [Petromyzon marinus]|uniref:cell surface hyaluronidase CEMIP2 isoform X2 n=1 Tax=Petromyzon marinus TaxID=7757 RepID=UPI003F7066EA
MRSAVERKSAERRDSSAVRWKPPGLILPSAAIYSSSSSSLLYSSSSLLCSSPRSTALLPPYLLLPPASRLPSTHKRRASASERVESSSPSQLRRQGPPGLLLGMGTESACPPGRDEKRATRACWVRVAPCARFLATATTPHVLLLLAAAAVALVVVVIVVVVSTHGGGDGGAPPTDGAPRLFPADDNCPDQNLSLSPWRPGLDESRKVVIGEGQFLRLEESASLDSIEIRDGGKLVFADRPGLHVALRARHVLVHAGGELHVGARACPYRARATIALYGRADEGLPVPGYGRKFLGVGAGGVLQLHGRPALSWTRLARTLHPAGLPHGEYSFEWQWGSRGINVRVLDPLEAQLLRSERFDTHESPTESQRLLHFLRALPPGTVVAVAVGDSAAKSLGREARLAVASLTGSRFVAELQYRYSWAMVAVIGGPGPPEEDLREYRNMDSHGVASASHVFRTTDGTNYSVTAYSAWEEGIPRCGFRVELLGSPLLTLAEDVRSWRAGERVVVASTDFSMHQAEEFTLLPCPECAANQVKVDGKPRFTHVGEVVDGVDMRAEVGLLTRNVVVQGEMEPSCYGDNACRFFSFDTFGGHIKVTANFSAVGLSHVELTRMGQQVLGSYPLHFHMCGAVDEPALYPAPPAVVGLAVHHCFSRCVTIHGTSGLQVSDTVGYDTLGHCFFMEDGAEQRNTLARNLGLLTRPGTLLPTDRGDAACLALRGAVHPGYTPNPSADCMAVSTFWISHPNNNLIDNAAAGAQDVGFWFAFHRVPTGPSAGALPEGHSELSPLGLFRNNRAHSNSKAGVFLDKGVKVTHASAQSPREYLSPVTARYRPHEDADPAKPAVAAVFDRLVAFRNDHGAWLRGGTISVRNSAFADNAIGITFASDGTFPTDEGSSQEVTDSIFVGESGNLGTNGGHNRFWGAGADGRFRTMARTSSFPVRGVQLYDGPCRVERCTFRHFAPTRDRRSSAIGFFLRNVWQMTPQNNVSRVRMDDSVKLSVNFGKPGPWFEDNDLDGDKNSIFHDVDGSVSGFPDSHVARADNALLWTPACHMQSDWNAMICPGRYAQLYVQARRPQNLTLSVRRERSAGAAAGVMTLRGLYPPSGSTAAFQQYQPVVQLGTDYSLRWDGPSPDEVTIYLVNFNRGDWVRVALCYPRGTAFSVVSDVHQRQLSQVHGAQRLHPAASPDALRAAHGRRLYFHDASTGLLHLHVSSSRERHGNAYCSATGCERVRIIATPPRGTAASTQPATCQEASEATTATAPSVAAAAPTSRSLSPAESSPSPNAEFPRDRLLGPVTTPCPGCGAPQLLITSDPHHTYLPIDIHVAEPGEIRDGGRVANYVEVNGTRLALDSPGLLLVAVDACSGRLLSKKTLRTPPVNVTRFTLARLPKRSIVVLASGQLNQTPADDLAAALLLIGAPSGVVPFQGGSLAMVGYLGDFTPPSWVKLTSKLPGSGATSLQAYVPLAWKGSGCLEAGEMGKGAAIEEGQGKAQASTSGQNTAYKPSRTSG